MASNASAEIADRVLLNDPDLQHLYLSSDSFTSQTQVDKLVQALASNQNTHLQHVYFRNFKLLLGGPLPLLLQALRHLNNLQSVFFHCTEVPVALLAEVFSNSSGQWTSLGLRYCKLKYEREEDCQLLEEALQSNSTLQDVCVECCEWQVEQGGTNSTNVSKMSSLLQAISHIPTLQHVECVLLATSTRQRFPSFTLKCLGRMPCIQSLRLRHVWMPQVDVAFLCQALASTTTLRKLLLSCDMGPTAALALGQLLQTIPLLQHLALRIDHLQDPDSPHLLAQALQNCALQHFHLSGDAAPELSTRAKLAFRDMIQCNSSLEFVRLDVSDYALQSEIAFYLQLNHKGRRALFQKKELQQTQDNNESTLWVQALCQNATDVRALHYFLALHPGFFATTALNTLVQQQQDNNNLTSHTAHQYADWDAEDGIVYDSDGW